MKTSDLRLLLTLLVLIVAIGGALLIFDAVNTDLRQDLSVALKANEALEKKRREEKQNPPFKKKPVPQPVALEDRAVEAAAPQEPGSYDHLSAEELATLVTEQYEAALAAFEAGEGQIFVASFKALLAIGKSAYPEVTELVNKIRKDPRILYQLNARPKDLRDLLNSEDLYKFHLYALISDQVTEEFRAQTVRVLARSGGTDTIPHLLGVLKDTTDNDVTNAAIDTLGTLEATTALPLFAKMLDEEISDESRLAILKSIGRIGDLDSADLLIAYAGDGFDEATRIAAVSALVRVGSDAAIPAALEALANGSVDVKREILRSVAENKELAQDQRIGETIIQIATAEEAPEVRRAAFGAVRNLEPAVAVETIVTGMASQPRNVRQSGLWNLAQIPTDGATQAIQTIAENDGDERVQRLAKRILQRRESGAATGMPFPGRRRFR